MTPWLARFKPGDEVVYTVPSPVPFPPPSSDLQSLFGRRGRVTAIHRPYYEVLFEATDDLEAVSLGCVNNELRPLSIVEKIAGLAAGTDAEHSQNKPT